MKKFVSLLFALLCMAFALPALADDEVDFGDYAIKIGDATREIIPNDQWYLIYNAQDYDSRYTGGGYFWDVYFGTYGDYGYVCSTQGPDVVADNMLGNYVKECLVRFIPADEPNYTAHDTYYMVFGTGHYIHAKLNEGSTSGYVYTYADITDATPTYVYEIEGHEGYFAMNTADENNNRFFSWGTNYYYRIYAESWGSDYVGDVTSTNSRFAFQILPVELFLLDDFDSALSNCLNTYNDYKDYSGTFTAGTTPGCYDAEAIAAFEAALEAASVCLDADVQDKYTAADLTQRADNLVDAYEALIATKVDPQVSIKDGYYFICHGIDEYYEGQPFQRCMYAYPNSDGTDNVLFTQLEETAYFLWKIEDAGDKTSTVYNMATNTTFNNPSYSNLLTLGSTSNTIAFDFAEVSESGDSLYSMRVSTREADSWYYFWGQLYYAAPSSNWVWVYKNTDNLAEWSLIEVDDATAEAIIEEYMEEEGRIRALYDSAAQMVEDFRAKEESMTVSQMSAMGSAYSQMAEMAEVFEGLSANTIDEDTYNDIKTCYDAFIALYVDPTELGEALDDVYSLANGLVVGTDPGTWSDASLVASLKAAYEEADDYYVTGSYTQEKVDEYVEALASVKAQALDASIKVEEGKWYKLRYATEAEVNANEWDPELGEATVHSPALYGKYVCAADLNEDEDGNFTVSPLTQAGAEDACIGQGLYFADAADINNEDAMLFRFIAAEGGYMLQNKATGLFLLSTGSGISVTLNAHPTLFNVTALGYGENLLAGAALNGDSNDNLAAQVERNVLAASTSSSAGSNSGLYIEENSAVEDSYDGTEFHLMMAEGAVYTMCYPVSVYSEEATLYGIELEGTEVTLLALADNTAEAGQPCVAVFGDLDDYEGADAEEELLIFTHGYELCLTAKTEGDLVGNYYHSIIGTGMAVPSGNTFEVTTSVASTAQANTAYIDGGFSTSDVITTTIGESEYDAIANVVSNVTKSGNIYSVDGKLLGKGNINTARRMGKGLYIVDGVKVVVR